MKTSYYKLSLFFVFASFLFSCTKDENGITSNDNEVVNEYPSTKWGMQMEEIQKQMKGYKSKITESDYLLYYDDKSNTSISFFFVNNKLEASTLQFRKEQKEKWISSSVSEYSYIGEFESAECYSNYTSNSTAVVYDQKIDGIDYCIVGFSPLNSELVRTLSTVKLTTLPATDISSEGAKLSCKYDGDENVDECGFVVSTQKNLLQSEGTKIAANNIKEFVCMVSGLEPESNYYFSPYICKNGFFFYGDILSFETKRGTSGVLDGHMWIDLGLPSGTLWAESNIGAEGSEIGMYFCWGELEEKSNYTLDDYKYFDYYGKNLAMYFKYTGKNIGATEKDVAYVTWGTSWRMPTEVEMKELFAKCKREWQTQNGTDGIMLTGPNNNKLFLPAGGYKSGTDIKDLSVRGKYWLSISDTGYANSCWYIGFSSNTYWDSKESGLFGFNVRAVVNK